MGKAKTHFILAETTRTRPACERVFIFKLFSPVKSKAFTFTWMGKSFPASVH